jgi:UDP-glucuronate 4-epimerase
MKILLTGTAGFIGFHLAKKLLERGDEVVGLDNINDYYDVNLKYARLKELGIEREDISSNLKIVSKKYINHSFYWTDLADTETIYKIFENEKFDLVINLAAQAGVRYSLKNPHVYIKSNVVGFMNILEGCRHYGVKDLIFASSSSVYGLNKTQPFKTSDRVDNPISLYASTKKSNEMMAYTYSHLYGIKATGLRFFTVYGEWGRPDMAPFIFTKAILNGTPIDVFNNGQMSRDFTYIDDIVDGIVNVIDKPMVENRSFDEVGYPIAQYKLYNIGNNKPEKLLKFIEILEDALEKKAIKNFKPLQDGDVISTYADVDDLINDFNYSPNTPLEVGIERFVKWYKEFYDQ